MKEENTTEDFAKVERLIKHTCAKFIQKYGGDLDEYIAEANLTFLKAHKTYKKELSAFSTYLVRCIQNRLRDLQRNDFQKRKYAKTVSMDALLPDGESKLSDGISDKFVSKYDLSEFSDDVQTVVKLVLDTPKEVSVHVMLDDVLGVRCRSRSFQGALRTYLEQQGWSFKRIMEAFHCIRSEIIPA